MQRTGYIRQAQVPTNSLYSHKTAIQSISFYLASCISYTRIFSTFPQDVPYLRSLDHRSFLCTHNTVTGLRRPLLLFPHVIQFAIPVYYGWSQLWRARCDIQDRANLASNLLDRYHRHDSEFRVRDRFQ